MSPVERRAMRYAQRIARKRAPYSHVSQIEAVCDWSSGYRAGKRDGRKAERLARNIQIDIAHAEDEGYGGDYFT